jgi:hypothetical protein
VRSLANTKLSLGAAADRAPLQASCQLPTCRGRACASEPQPARWPGRLKSTAVPPDTPTPPGGHRPPRGLQARVAAQAGHLQVRQEPPAGVQQPGRQRQRHYLRQQLRRAVPGHACHIRWRVQAEWVAVAQLAACLCLSLTFKRRGPRAEPRRAACNEHSTATSPSRQPPLQACTSAGPGSSPSPRNPWSTLLHIFCPRPPQPPAPGRWTPYAAARCPGARRMPPAPTPPAGQAAARQANPSTGAAPAPRRRHPAPRRPGACPRLASPSGARCRPGGLPLPSAQSSSRRRACPCPSHRCP